MAEPVISPRLLGSPVNCGGWGCCSEVSLQLALMLLIWLSALVQPTRARGRSLGGSGVLEGAEAASKRATGITPELSPPRTVME